MAGKVIVKINPQTGESTYEVNGIEGTGCEQITQAIVRANEEVEKQYTEEYETPAGMPEYITNPSPEGEE